MAENYVSLDELKASAELTGFSFADYDAKIALSAASRGIDEYCGRRFWADADATSVRYFTALDSGCVSIDDAISVGTVQVDYDGDGVFDTTWAASDYRLSPLNAAADGKPYEEIQARPWMQGFPCWQGSVKVTGQFGWLAVPDQVKEATTIMATRLLKRAREAPFGIISLTGAESTAIHVARTDPDTGFLLDPFVRGQGVMVA